MLTHIGDSNMDNDLFCTIASAPLDELVPTTADVEWPACDAQQGEQWQQVLDQLIDWALQPELIADEGIDAPSRKTLRLAARLAIALRDAGRPTPDRIVPDPNGGLVFVYEVANGASEFHIWDDGSVDYCIFDDTRLVSRHILV